jgi:hypothetical protein
LPPWYAIVVSDAHETTHRLVEVTTMALYVSIALLAALAAVDGDALSRSDVMLLIWGTSLGLAVAHYVAFRLASALARGRHLGRGDVVIAGVQFTGAMIVPAVVTGVELVIGGEDGDDVVGTAQSALAVILGVTGYLVSRGNGASRRRAVLIGLGVLVVGTVTALIKNFLTGH